MMTVEIPTKPSSIWTVLVCMAGEALGKRTLEVYSFHCCRFWQIVLPAIVFPEQFEISWVYYFMSIGVQELLSSGENKYKNPEARLQREMSLQKNHRARKGVCLVCLIFLLLSGILGFLLQGLHQDDKLESFQNGNTIPWLKELRLKYQQITRDAVQVLMEQLTRRAWRWAAPEPHRAPEPWFAEPSGMNSYIGWSMCMGLRGIAANICEVLWDAWMKETTEVQSITFSWLLQLLSLGLSKYCCSKWKYKIILACFCFALW